MSEHWSFIRRVLEQGMAIQQDYQAGKYPDYELLSARLDDAARERVGQLEAIINSNGKTKDHNETPARTPPAADARVGESTAFTDSLRGRGFFGDR